MFAVLYRFEIKPGDDEAFVASWAEATRAIKAHHRHRGSRLHQDERGGWFAYTVWESREKWQARTEGPAPLQRALARMGEHVERVEVLHELEVRADLLDDGP